MSSSSWAGWEVGDRVGAQGGHRLEKRQAQTLVFFGSRTEWMFGSTPPEAMVTPPRNLLSSSSLRTAKIGLNPVCLSHRVCFPFLFSLQHPLFSSLFSRENSVEIVKFWALSRV